METDTIAAISTPIGEGGISIVRMSGPQAIHIAAGLFSGAKLTEVASHTIHYGHIMDPETSDPIDEVMSTVFKAPKTFTREDIVEVNCHGGLTAVNRILDVLLTNGARLAEPGEFTKRAFLNGRIDLSQAEAVMDLIRAKTDKAMSMAYNQLEGRLSNLIRQYRQDLLETVAHVEVNIDYPEYDDVEEMSQDIMRDKTQQVHANIEELLNVAKQGKILREGIATAIIGRPNVGKSSLLNVLAQEDKAIVTEIPGTTRDAVEEYVNVRGVPLKLVDTAGIRETDDIVEQMGVDRSRQALKQSDLILFVMNYNEPLSDEDWQVLEMIGDLDYIIIINKTDLTQELDMEHVKKIAGTHPVVEMSVTESQGVDHLENAIADIFFAGELDSGDMTYVSNVRHIQLLKQAKSSLEDAMDALEMGMPLDVVQIDVSRTWELLGEIIGDTASESLINQLFSQFCLGK